MNYRRYNRSVTVFAEQNWDFALPGKEAGGNLKIETGNNRGAMRCSLMNLQPYVRGEYLYKLILFGTRGERTIHAVVGTVPVNRSGNGDAYFRFDPLDVNGKGDEYGYFTTAIVAAVSMKNSGEPLHPVLKGSLGNETADTASASPRKSSEIVRQKEKSREPEEHDSAGLKSNTGPSAEQRSEAEQEKEPPAERRTLKSFNRFYNDYLLHFCIQTCQMADYYEEVWPFVKDQTGARWKKILNVGHFPLISPGAHYFAGKYRHYLFGARPDGRGYASCYFLAVPGQNTQTEQPDGGKSGFLYWQPAKGQDKGSENSQDPCGYWIVEIDGQTGDIREVFH